MKYKRLTDGFIMTQEQASRFWDWQYYYLTAEERGAAIWQAAFDNVLAGVDEEIIEAVAAICRTEVHCLGNIEDFSAAIW